MKSITRAFNLFKPPQFQDEEKNRIASITYIIAMATLSGVSILLGNRLILGAFHIIIPMSILTLIIIVSLFLIRRGFLHLSGGLLLWTLFVICNYFIVTNNGIYDSATLIIPGVLVIGGAILSRKHYFVYTIASLLTISIIGYLEIAGFIQNDYSSKVSYINIADIVVMLGIIAFTVRLLSDNLIRGFSKAVTNEKRYHSLFEGANDVIFIMRGDRIIECNAMAVRIFGCEDYQDLVHHTPWEYSPLQQPDGKNSKEKAWEIIQEVLDGRTRRFYWKHARKNGSLFDADVSLNALELGGEKLIQAIVRDITERKEMEERIHESEEYYRTLIETSPDAIITVNPNGQLSFVSARAKSMFQVPPEYQALGTSFIEWVAADDREKVKQRFSELVSGRSKPDKQEFKFLKYDHSSFWGELVSSPVIDTQGKISAVLTVCRDITERKQAEDALHESAERMKVIVEGTPDLFFYTQDANANSTYVSPTVERITGYPVDVWLKRTDWFITDAEINQTAREKTFAHMRGEFTDGPTPIEVTHADGRKIMLEAYENPIIKDGIVVGLQGVVHDVTARMKMEAALRQSEEKFSKAFHANPAAFVLVRFSDREIIEINESFETMTGYSRVETIGKTAVDLGLWVNLQDRDTMLHELIAKSTTRDKESQFRRKDGSLIIGNYSAELLSIDDEPFILVSIIDNTKRKLAEEAVRISRDQLRTLAVKLESIREEERKHIAREIHDQLGQILTGLKMNLSWISKKITAEDALKKKTEYMLDLIDMAIQSVRKIATDLRPGVLDELGLEAAIEWQAIEFERHSGVACQLNIKKDPELAKQEFSIAVFRIFQEALTNIARHAKATLVQISLAVENNSFYLHIEDNGKGITEEELHDPKSIGILGMKERALPFGGEVIVSPKEGKGTTVSARFPLR